LTQALLATADLSKATAPGARLLGANLVGAVARLADFSCADFSNAVATDASFERAALARAVLADVSAERIFLEFADLECAEMRDANFANGIFVGANLTGARAVRCNFHAADFYWTALEQLARDACNVAGARSPEPVEIVYGPSDVETPIVAPAPLYRLAADSAARNELIAAALEKGACAQASEL
jgi:uncharacterized protein YjbI with pentapeptide repeats